MGEGGRRDEGPGPLSPVVFHILLALHRETLHGYAVMKRVEADSGLSMGPGTIYGALDRLVETGWVAEAGPAGGDARRGTAFELTPDGRAHLAAEARRLTRLADLREVRGLLSEAGS